MPGQLEFGVTKSFDIESLSCGNLPILHYLLFIKFARGYVKLSFGSMYFRRIKANVCLSAHTKPLYTLNTNLFPAQSQHTCLWHTHTHPHCKNTHGCPANRERPTAYHTHAITHSPCCWGKMELEAEEWIKSTLTLSQSFLLADGNVILLVWNYPESSVRDHEICVKSFYMVKY